jgi:hypothetical protein
MFASLRPRRVEQPASMTPELHRRHFLSGWDAADFDGLKYSYGLTGVDQDSNFLWVDVFLYTLAALSIFLLGLRVANMFWRHQRHLTVMANPTNQNYWASNRTSWWPWLNPPCTRSAVVEKAPQHVVPDLERNRQWNSSRPLAHDNARPLCRRQHPLVRMASV